MPVPLAIIETPLTPPQVLQQLLGVLQGVSPMIQVGAASGPVVGTGVVTIAGNATAAAQVVIKIIASGQIGTASYQASFDGGLTFGGTVTTPNPTSAIALGTLGVTIAFSNGLYQPAPPSVAVAGSFQAGEQYQFITSTPNFPVTNWGPGSVPMALLLAEATSLSDLSQLVAQVAAGGFAYSWITPPPSGPPPSGWLDLLAQYQYNVPSATGGSGRNLAVATQGQVTVTNTSTTPYTILVGQLLIASAATGRLYTNTTGGTLPAFSATSGPGTLPLQVIAQVPAAAGNLGSDLPGIGHGVGDFLTVLQTPLAGVTVDNPLNAAPLVAHAGSGTGSVSVNATAATQEWGVSIQITSAGGIGSGGFSWSTNGGQSYTPVAGGIPASFPVPGTNTTVSFSGTFATLDLHAYSTAWTTVRGSDQESDLSLATRCVAQWGSLAAAGPAAIYVNWAKAASAEVVAAAAGPDPIVPGTVDVLLSGPGGASVSATALAAVTSYINARVPLGARVSVQTVQVLQVQPGVPIPAVAGSGIFIFSAQFASATLGITAALAALQARVTIGGTVYLSQVVDAIQNVAGVRNIEGLVLIVPAGSLANTTPGDVALAPGQGVQFVAPAPATLVAV